MTMKYLTPDAAATLNNMNPASQNNRLGDNLKYLLDNVGVIGRTVYLDPANGNDDNNGFSPDQAKKTLPEAYDVLRDNKNDVLYYIANNGSIVLDEAFTWDKNYTHFIGICAPVGAAKRARIFQDSSATGIDLFTMTATGCVFKNIYYFHGVDDATSKKCFTLSGSRNYFENCNFAGIGHDTMNVAGACSLFLNGAEENLFYNCQIGLDTVGRDANPNEILFDGASARNVFADCLINAYLKSGATAYSLIEVADTTAIDRYQLFKNCMFLTDSENQAVTMASAFSIPSGIVQGKIILKDCMLLTDGTSGSGDWDANDRGIIWSNTPAPAAAAAGGIATKQ